MTDPDGVEALIAFAASEFADENMLFWAAAQKFATAEGDEVAKQGAEIIDKFLCATAEMQVNLPSALSVPFAKASGKGEYTWAKGMFGTESSGQVGEIYKLIRNDTFARFKYSDRAKELLEEKPQLAVGAQEAAAEDDALDDMIEGSVAMARKSRANKSLASTLEEWAEATGCVRLTLWMVHQPTGRMFNVSSTQLGNAMISIPVGIGLAGAAADKGVDIHIDDAYNDPTFNKAVDLATGFRTKQVCCVALREAEGTPVLAVAQLINKKEGAGDAFTDDDIATVRKSVQELLPLFKTYENTRVSKWSEVVA